MTDTIHPDPGELRDLVVTVLEDAKAEAIEVLDLREHATFADFMIVASGSSSRQVRAMAQRLDRKVREQGRKPLGIEGESDGEWVLVDLSDVIVHLMLPQTRAHYNLEKLWSTPPPTRSALSPLG